MDKQYNNIIKDIEDELEVPLNSNIDIEILCDGDTCRHSNCVCRNQIKELIHNYNTENL